MKNLIQRYLQEEPELAYADEIRQLLEQDASDELSLRFEGLWRFGTAGFRAKMGSGRMRLNRVSVAKIAYAVAKYLSANSKVVIGFDGRHHSNDYAILVAQILNAAGHEASVFQKMVPTPICAFAVTYLKANAGIMITASHNPPADNGIKIYGEDGAQLIAPHTNAIEAVLDNAPDFGQITLSQATPSAVPESVIDAYFASLPTRGSAPTTAKIVYTPMHGVGGDFATRALESAGFHNVHMVASQAKPDGNFPTVEFPNPEEPGALNEALAALNATQADLILANDPDADRLAVCIGQTALTGNQIGVLLGSYLIENRQPSDKQPLVMSTVVSSRMLSKIAAKNGVSYAETITGFANIAHQALEREASLNEAFLFGYEEALGYCVGNHVRDKDGISAAVAFAQLFSELAWQNKTVFDELDRLSLTYGLHRSLAWSCRGELKTILARSENIQGFEKQTAAHPGLLIYSGNHDLRLIVRPSGTEPKIKFYAEVIAYPKTPRELSDMTLELDAFLKTVQDQVNLALQG